MLLIEYYFATSAKVIQLVISLPRSKIVVWTNKPFYFIP